MKPNKHKNHLFIAQTNKWISEHLISISLSTRHISYIYIIIFLWELCRALWPSRARGLTAGGCALQEADKPLSSAKPSTAAKNVVNPLFDREIYATEPQRTTFDIIREMFDTKSRVVQQQRKKPLWSAKLSVRKEVGETSFRPGYKWERRWITKITEITD